MKFVLIGAGQRGMIYARYAREKGHEIAAVAEPDGIKRRIAGDELGVPDERRFVTGSELLAQPKLADVMLICTPDRCHYTQAKAALLKDYDLLLEKPIAPKAEQCGELRDIAMARLFEETAAICHKPKKVANWLMGETMRLLKERDMEPEDLRIDPRSLADLIDMTDRGTINSTTAKDVFEVIFDHTIDVKKYVEDHGLSMVSDFSELEEIITEIITVNPGPVADYHAGKKKAAGFLVGQVMKKTGGKANPAMVRELLEQKLENG